MIDSWHEFRQKASRSPQRIVLADGEDPRVIQAAAIAKNERIAEPVLIGDPIQMDSVWSAHADGFPLQAIDPSTYIDRNENELLDDLLSCPHFKDLSRREARRRLQDPLLLGCLYLKRGQADGFIGGATRTTADTLRAVFSVTGLAARAGILFGLFLIERQTHRSPKSLVLLADGAVIPDPSSKQLADIGIRSAEAYTFFTGQQARVAFLSFSTRGSAQHVLIDKVRRATELAREKAPHLSIDGEWQGDTALDVFSAGIKGAGDSPMAGQANVLIVPDLNCGNIAYKLVQRLGGCRAVGPVLWGTAQPANDLSRGCSVEDVLDMIALTSLQAQAAKTPGD
ncbi:MAG: phosphate acyltransferase [Elusimicrobiota bacterium]|jgi:phosphate acetyltransferase